MMELGFRRKGLSKTSRKWKKQAPGGNNMKQRRAIDVWPR